VARLTLAGPRAVDRLADVVGSEASSPVRIAALRALEAIAEPAALPSILHAAYAADPDVAVAAVGAAGPFLPGRHGPLVVDRLTALALDPARAAAVRVAAVRALRVLKRATLAPLLKRLARDSNETLRLEARRPNDFDPVAVLTAAAAGDLPADPEELWAAIHEAGQHAPLTSLLGVVQRIKAREEMVGAPGHRAGPDARDRAAWTRVRGRAHLVLASRGSRVALYDLRESLSDAPGALPVEFLSALMAIGDASCLDAVVAAYARTTTDDWWRRQLAAAFRAIVAREKLTRRHAAIRKLDKRHPELLERLWTSRSSTPSRTRPR
jgi:hypothetical protein